MSDNQMNRRSLVKTALWAAPAIVAVTAAPAFAASDPMPPVTPGIPVCVPEGCKHPGHSNPKKVKSYRLAPMCTDNLIKSVQIDGIPAVLGAGGAWWVHNRDNSRSTLLVRIDFHDGGVWINEVKFPPCMKNH